MNAPTKPTIATKRVRRMAREPQVVTSQGGENQASAAQVGTSTTAESAARSAKAPTKAQIILGLLRRDEGATLEQLVAATGWLPHTTRAALTGIKRKGHALSSDKIDGV